MTQAQQYWDFIVSHRKPQSVSGAVSIRYYHRALELSVPMSNICLFGFSLVASPINTHIIIPTIHYSR